MYDAVQLIAKGLSELDKTHDFRIRPLNCDGTETWLYGPTLIDLMAKVINLQLQSISIKIMMRFK